MATVRRLACGSQLCGRITEGGAREWLVPDGRGGCAMGTVSGLRTRRYHGLLVVAGGTPAVGLVHRLLPGGPVSLSLEAICTWRDVHAERTAAGPPPTVTGAEGGCVV